MPTSPAATFVLRVPNRNLMVTDRLAVFCHPWRGTDLVWIIPLNYIHSLKPIGELLTRVRISQAYFEVPIAETGWRAEWERHISQ